MQAITVVCPQILQIVETFMKFPSSHLKIINQLFWWNKLLQSCQFELTETETIVPNRADCHMRKYVSHSWKGRGSQSYTETELTLKFCSLAVKMSLKTVLLHNWWGFFFFSFFFSPGNVSGLYWSCNWMIFPGMHQFCWGLEKTEFRFPLHFLCPMSYLFLNCPDYR